MTEYELARTNCVLFDHPNYGVIEVSGNDRVSFLHNVLSNDIKSLTPGKGIPACLLDAQAKIIAQVNVLVFGDFIWLAFDYALKENLIKALEALVIMEEVKLEDKSDDLKLVSIHGPKSAELSEILIKKELCGLLDHETTTINGMRTTVMRVNLIGETGFGFLLLESEANVLKRAINQVGDSLDLIYIHPETWEVLRIEAGIPKYGIDYDESNIPLEVRLDNTVSFSKGCFPGQEILARLDSRTGVTRKLVGIVLEGKEIPKKGFRILKDNQEIGLVTSAAFSPKLNKPVVLGILKKESWEPGTEILVEQIPAKVSKLPF